MVPRIDRTDVADSKPQQLERTLSKSMHERLASLTTPKSLALLRSLRRGIEKESLRVDRRLQLAPSPHPARFGSALTHPLITTDYSEALMEFITPVSMSIADTLTRLEQIHQVVQAGLGEEMLWGASMPGALGADDEIPVAQYGDSNVGRMKTIYRVGLGHRYGRRMQTISGIHYNFSLPDALWPLLGCHDQVAIDDAYFALIRNFRRLSWLLVYLFGASPVVSRSFLEGRSHSLQPLDASAFHLPYATSLRMGDLGYQSSAQQRLHVSYEQLDDYIGALRHAILDPYPAYQGFGNVVDGEYRQLSAGLLQLENEFYSLIRPKRAARRGETALTALAHGGVDYVEVRCLDVNPFLPLGIDAGQMRFLDAFLLLCLLEPSPNEDDRAARESRSNLRKVVNLGRQPGLLLEHEGLPVPLQTWASDLLDRIAPLAALLDRAHASRLHAHSVQVQRAKVRDSALTPSARVLAEMRCHGEDWSRFVARHSNAHASHFKRLPIDAARLSEFKGLAERSISEQRELEARPQLPFEEYLARYFDQYRALSSTARHRRPRSAIRPAPLEGQPAA